MHHTFRIPEILHLIFAKLQIPIPHRQYFSRSQRKKCLGCRDFAALARTCKIFRDPALDFLWREQDTLVNLLKCLPSHLWEEKTEWNWGHSRRIFRITGPVRPEDWDIPLVYALRIQRLELRSNDSDILDEFSMADIFQMIGSGLPRNHICPNLKSLLFGLEDEDLFPGLGLFLGPNIIDLDISLFSSGSHASSLPTQLNRYPNLQRLRLCSYVTRDAFSCGILAEIVSSLSRIEDLVLDRLGEVTVEHLAQLPSLTSLALRFPDLGDLGPSPRFRSLRNSLAPPFSSLRDLSLGDTSLEFAIEFLNLLSNSCLASFNIGMSMPVKSATSQLYAALVNHLRHSTLQTLEVVLTETETDFVQTLPPGDAIANYVVDGHSLALLLCFTNLTEITLEPPAGFDIDDTLAWDIARAWARVKKLSLTAPDYTDPDLRQPPSMSLHGLSAFAKHCRELKSLTIIFDASTIPPLDETVVSQSCLASLAVDVSPITDSPAVASFIAALFPRLAKIYTYYYLWMFENVDSDDENAPARWERERGKVTRWKEVEVLIPKLAARKLPADV
ncbi:hypothetical protein K438DRAFT_1879252 [Mycena galopus ATCC 62051]|nr:hypothetical protein K438DRAFT_1879252 [Mycena galopus ATCC 62051]